MKSRIFIIIGLLCLIAAAGLAMYNLNLENNAQSSSDAVLEYIDSMSALDADDKDSSKKNKNKDKDNDNDGDSGVYNPSSAGYTGGTSGNGKSGWTYEGKTYSMIIDIPKIDRRLPVLDHYKHSYLEYAPCIYTGSIYTDNLVICGHNYKTHFKWLKKLTAGDKIYLTDYHGISYKYKVIDVEVLGPFEYTAMTESDADLTIFTCTWGGKTRLTVRCERARYL